jgi:hypothetical protein
MESIQPTLQTYCFVGRNTLLHTVPVKPLPSENRAAKFARMNAIGFAPGPAEDSERDKLHEGCKHLNFGLCECFLASRGCGSEAEKPKRKQITGAVG